MKNMPPATAPLLIYIHPFVDVRERFPGAILYGRKQKIAGEASAGSADGAAHTGKVEVGGASTYRVSPLSLQSCVDVPHR